jgi:hypothetical protein
MDYGLHKVALVTDPSGIGSTRRSERATLLPTRV